MGGGAGINVFSAILIGYTGSRNCYGSQLWEGPKKEAFSKGDLGPGLIGLRSNEDEWMTKGRSHGRLFLVFLMLKVFIWFVGIHPFSNGFSGFVLMWLGVDRGT